MVTATITKPEDSTTRSPTLSIKRPLIGEEINRVSANIETTVLAANAVTPNDLAKSGIAGATMPKPRATENAMEDKTQIAGGRSLMLPADFALLDTHGSLFVAVILLF